MKYAFSTLALLMACAGSAQTSRTYTSDSTTHYFLGIKKSAFAEMPNLLTDIDTLALKNHPMVKDPLDIRDGLGVMRAVPNMKNPGFQKYDFQKPEKYENELNYFTPKFKK